MKLPTILKHPAGWLATGFGSGLAPFAPGTVGSAAAILPWLLLRELPWPAYLAVVALAFALGVWVSQWAIRHLNDQDPKAVVWDEFVGLWLTLFLLPPGWLWLLAGFLTFRAFDVLKPWPVSWADREVKGGLGVMLDDLLAALYALALLQGLHFLLGAAGRIG